jgi:RNA polymerase sigma factor (sigma-70 family)
MSLRVRLPVRFYDPHVADDDFALVHRFAESHDESAFTGLVNRHARMVFGVCRRTVGDAHLAEDAFQAVFLVLARKPKQAAAASSVGGWLFGIARRVGMATRRHEMRRQKHVTNSLTQKPEANEPNFDDLLRVLDEELATLPDTYRASLVACFLEERTQDEAARQLGWSLSTLRRRLERGKELLRARLLRRGVTLAAGLFAGALAPSARAAVSSRLIDLTATPAATSQLADLLASEVVRGTLTTKVWFVAMIVVALGGLAMGIGQLLPSSDSPKENGVSAATAQILNQDAAPNPRLIEQKPWVTVSGRVVFPEERDLLKPKAVPVNLIKDKDFFTAGGELFHTDILINPKTRGIANVIVWLRPDNDHGDSKFPAEKINPVLARAEPVDRPIEADRYGFIPRVMAARVGDRLVFSNPTQINFNVNYHHPNAQKSDMNGSFNILLPSGKTHYHTLSPVQRLLPDYISDSIHPWVQGYVRAFEHPYFAVTDESGNFQIKDAPAGSWRLVVWHERIGYKGGAEGRLGERIAIADQGNASQKLEPIVLNSDQWEKQ